MIKIDYGARKIVYIPIPLNGWVYITFKNTNSSGNKNTREEEIYTHSLQADIPDFVADALPLEASDKPCLDKIPLLRDKKGIPQYVYKKPFAEPVNEMDPSMYRHICMLIDSLAESGYIYIEMKPDNVGILNKRLVILDAEQKDLHRVPDKFIEYYKQISKLIAFYSFSESYPEQIWNDLNPEELKHQIGNPDVLRFTDLTEQQKREIEKFNTKDKDTIPLLNFPNERLKFYSPLDYKEPLLRVGFYSLPIKHGVKRSTSTQPFISNKKPRTMKNPPKSNKKSHTTMNQQLTLYNRFKKTFKNAKNLLTSRLPNFRSYLRR